MKILNFGSINLDYVYRVDHFVRKGETLSADNRSTFPGGKGLNQSVALARAGATVWHAGCIGADGTELRELLVGEGVNVEHLRVLQEVPTGHAVIQNDVSGDNAILILGGANREITEDHVRAAMRDFSEGDCLLLQNEINALPFIAAAAKERHMQIALNPSPVDRNLTDDLLEKVDWFLLNEGEAAALSGVDPADPRMLLSAMQEKYPAAAIVLTLGEEGAIAAIGGAVYRQSVFPVEPVDTTAAGDTFTGYFLSAVWSGQSPQKALEQAARAASIAVTRPGAAPSIPHLRELENPNA